MPNRPNIVFLMTDQHRGDCLGIDGHPAVQTPHLDEVGTKGVHFRKAYSACPLCMPARRTLLSGTSAKTHGLVGNVSDIELQFKTLPQVLRDAGYQTHLTGKLHFWPERKRYGFDSMDWCDGPYGRTAIGDYGPFLDRETGGKIQSVVHAHGTTLNSWLARPWHLEERLHLSNWTTEKALEFLKRRDPTAPYFLMVSYFHPHQPVTPPQFYYDRYMNMDLEPPVVGDWAEDETVPQGKAPVRASRVKMTPEEAKQYQAGYFGCINHIDDQIGRILYSTGFYSEQPRDTLFIFVSDHGEMLGDHYWVKKSLPFEASARVPFLMKLPKSHHELNEQVCDKPVELMDIMPTILDILDIPAPEEVEGKSILPILQNESATWRDYIHGECAQHGAEKLKDFANQFLTDGLKKYIWYPMTGREMYFDLTVDPQETKDLSNDPDYQEEISMWRERLIHELKDREENFTDGEKLTPLKTAPPLMLSNAFPEETGI